LELGGRQFAVWRVARDGAHLLLELTHDQFAEPAGQARHLGRHLRIEHAGAHLGGRVVQHAGAHGGGPHALHQLLHEQALELLGRFADDAVLLTPGGGKPLEVVERTGVETQAHQITSSSACKAPAACMACRMASRSCGLAPRLLRALTTSVSRVPAGISMREPASWFRRMSAFSLTTVWPCEKAPGWLMTGV